MEIVFICTWRPLPLTATFLVSKRPSHAHAHSGIGKVRGRLLVQVAVASKVLHRLAQLAGATIGVNALPSILRALRGNVALALANEAACKWQLWPHFGRCPTALGQVVLGTSTAIAALLCLALGLRFLLLLRLGICFRGIVLALAECRSLAVLRRVTHSSTGIASLVGQSLFSPLLPSVRTLVFVVPSPF